MINDPADLVVGTPTVASDSEQAVYGGIDFVYASPMLVDAHRLDVNRLWSAVASETRHRFGFTERWDCPRELSVK